MTGNAQQGALAREIPRRTSVSWWLGLALAVVFAVLVVPSITADRWLDPHVVAGDPAGLTVRVPPLSSATDGKPAGIVIARGELATGAIAREVAERRSSATGSAPYLAFLLLAAVLGAIFTHHMRRSNRGRLVRVQLASLGAIVIAAAAVKAVLLITTASILIVPVAVFAIVPTLVLDRVVGLATGILAALIFSFVGPFDLAIACLFLVQAAVAGLVVAERPKYRWRAALIAGGAATLCTAVTYPLLQLLQTGSLPTGELADVLHSPWYAATLGPVIATVVAVPLVAVYQHLVGEITQTHLTNLTDLSHPLLKQIAERAPGTWQHSLMMANLAEIAANAIGADGRLVRVGAYFHDLGKSLQPKYFIENLEPGETSPHDQLPPEVSCEAIFKHVTEGIVAARKAGLHERIVDFMHMHHGNGVLEYFWGKARDQGNPKGLTIEDFRYPGHPPQSRETAILAICDAVEAASRTLKKPDVTAIENLVQRIVYGKLHLGQLDESGLSMGDLRRVADSLRETIKHANHGRIEYPWQKEAAAAAVPEVTSDRTTSPTTTTSPRLDSLDRAPVRKSATETTADGKKRREEEALAETADLRGTLPIDPDELASEVATKKPMAVLVDEPPSAQKTAEDEAAAIAQTAPVVPHPRVQAEDPPRLAVKPLEIAPLELRPSQINLELVPAPAARKRAATLPPTPSRRSPTIPPTPAPRVRPASGLGPAPALAARGKRSDSRPESRTVMGRPIDQVRPFDDNAVTNPPPMSTRRPALDEWTDHPTATPPPGTVEPHREPETLEMPIEAIEALANEAGRTLETMPAMREPNHTDVTRPRILMPLTASASQSDDPQRNDWAAGLAARIDAAVSDDEFGGETPIIAPTKAELRALVGTADPTRRQSVEEVEAMVLRDAAEQQRAEDAEPDLLRRRPYPTAEVNPDDIEAIIEIAPAARRHASSIGVAKPKKPE